MSKLKIALPAIVLIAGFAVCTTTSYGKAEFTKKEKKGCTFCHTKANSKELNDAGKYYKEHNNSLEGYQAAEKK
jgi:hypothetical protein